MNGWAIERYLENDTLTDEELDQIANDLADAYEDRADAARKGE